MCVYVYKILIQIEKELLLLLQDLRNFTYTGAAMAMQFVLIYNLLWRVHSMISFYFMSIINFGLEDFD